MYPESVTATADGTLYVSSFASGGVMRVPPGASEAKPWIAPGAFGTRSTFGVLADAASGILWVCSNDLSALGVPGPSEVKGSALKGFDLETGSGKISVALPGDRAICNDIAIAANGAVYVTNTLSPEILRLKTDHSAFEVWARDPRFQAGAAGLDGIAFGMDGDLYVTTYTKAELFRIAVTGGTAGAITQLKTSRPLVLADGLRPLDDGSFLLAEGGGSLDRVTVQGDTATIETIRDGFAGGLTGLAKVSDRVWVAEGQLAALMDPSKKAAGPTLPFRLHTVPFKP